LFSRFLDLLTLNVSALQVEGKSEQEKSRKKFLQLCYEQLTTDRFRKAAEGSSSCPEVELAKFAEALCGKVSNA
jgi:hypothetical protein